MKTALKGLFTAAAAMMMGVSATGSAPAQGQSLGPMWEPTGTWLIEVTLRDCATGNPFETFLVMNSFAETGSLIEYGTTPMITPAHRTPGLGDWHRIEPRRFRAVFSLFFLPDAVNVAALHRIERTIRMTGRDSFTAESAVKIFDPTGNVQIATGCGTETARRLS